MGPVFNFFSNKQIIVPEWIANSIAGFTTPGTDDRLIRYVRQDFPVDCAR